MRSASVILIGALFALSSYAQVFEVASIKPNASGESGGLTNMIDRTLTARNVPLRGCIANAYQVKSIDVQGPAWMDTERFDITAKAPADDAHPDLSKMFQALLAERFKLQVHTGTKESPGFALKVAKSGIKLKDVGAQPLPGAGGRQGSNGSHIVATYGMTMQTLAQQLAMRLRVPVVDMTEAPDYFVVNLAFTVPSVATQPGGELEAPEGRPWLFTALQEQAGLRLESMKVAVPIVIVDSVEKKPTEN